MAYTGDTSMGETLLQPGVMDAKVLITECTFFEPDHRKRAQAGSTCMWRICWRCCRS